MSAGGDNFKEFPVRLFGYSFGIAQASKYILSDKKIGVISSMGVFFVFVHVIRAVMIERVLVSPVVGVLCFEIICSCVIPPLVIYFVGGLVREFLSDIEALPCFVAEWSYFATGLAMLPVLYWYVEPEVDMFIKDFILTKIPK